MHSNLIQYFNACYQADNREQSLWDIFSKDCEFLQAIPTHGLRPLLNTNSVAVNAQYGFAVQAAIETYRREKVFLYGHYLLAGLLPVSQSFGGKAKRVCSPLILFDASLEMGIDSDFCISLDKTSARWNTALLNQLIDDKDFILGLDDEIKEDALPSHQYIADILKKYNAKNRSIDVVDSLLSLDDLRTFKKKATASTISIALCGAALLTKRSSSSRGIIDELNLIQASRHISRPLSTVLKQCKSVRSIKANCRLDNVPGILSSAQQRALENAAKKEFSLLVGPPGTGKSYTIACIILESFMRGESVLVVSQNEYAVDVIQEKLVQTLGLSSAAVLRAGEKDYHRYLKQYIENITKGIGLDEPGPHWRSKLDAIKKKIKKSEQHFLSLSNAAVVDGIYLEKTRNVHFKPGWIGRYKLWRQQQRLKKYGLLCGLLSDVQNNHFDREDILAKHINHTYLTKLHRVLNRNRSELMQFNSALRARTSSTQEARFAQIDYSILLKALPVWLSSLSSLHKTLPLKPELFDLLIIDEATQCDIASCIPALYRAKRAVVVGDPKQLRHFSFLSRKKQYSLQQKIGIKEDVVELNYRDKSMIDFADNAIASQDQVVMLDEHYRSLPDIIDFSNKRFYQNGLRVMTEKPSLKSKSGVEIIKVSKANRKNGVNKVEIEAVVDKLKELLEKQKNIPDQYKLSIGVLSFFRDQAEAIQKALLKNFDLDTIIQHQLRAGTPYAFQGEERDIMLISSVVDKDSSGSVYTYLNRPDVFNVAITRARDLQLLFLSVDSESMPHNNLLRLYIESIGHYQHTKSIYDLARDKNVDELSLVLSQNGVKVLRHYPIAGVSMDLVAMYESQTIAIDLVGFPGEHEDVLHLDRYKIFERAGLTIFPLSYIAWIYEREKVIEQIKKRFSLLVSKKVDRLSLQQMSTRWVKLLSTNADLAKRVRALEFSLVEVSYEQGLLQLDTIIESYNKLNWVLEQRLNSGELTYIRYRTVADQVFDGVLINLDKAFVLIKIASDHNNNDAGNSNTDVEKERRLSIDALLADNAEAIVSLNRTALKWSQLDTASPAYGASFKEALQELDRLEQKVEHYSTHDPAS